MRRDRRSKQGGKKRVGRGVKYKRLPLLSAKRENWLNWLGKSCDSHAINLLPKARETPNTPRRRNPGDPYSAGWINRRFNCFHWFNVTNKHTFHYNKAYTKAMLRSLLRLLLNMLHALFCVRSHIISQKDLFQTPDWHYEVSLKWKHY